MMTCREVSTLLSTGRLDDAAWRARMAVRLHLAMCRHCRAFKRQLDSLASAARSLSTDHQAEPPSDYEARVFERLQQRRRGAPDE